MGTNIFDGFENDLRMKFAVAAEEIVTEEIRQAQQEIDKRMRDLLAKTVMSISKWYSVEFQQDRIIIEVKQHI